MFVVGGAVVHAQNIGKNTIFDTTRCAYDSDCVAEMATPLAEFGQP